MRRKIILISIIFSLFLSPAISSAQTTTRQRIDHYEVIRENVAWYQKIAMMFLGLNWDKVSIKTTFSKNKNESEKIVSVIAWPDNAETENPEESEIVFQLDGNIKEVESFLDFLKMIKIGVLCLQGAFREHITALKKCKAFPVQVIEVRLPEDMNEIQALIMPGGESTTITKLMIEYKLDKKILDKHSMGMPIFGTCEGAINLAKKI